MNEIHKTRVEEREGRLSDLRESIKRAFPAEPYTGQITCHDDRLDDPELDEEKELYEALKGKRWTDIPKHLLDSQPDGYVLLTDTAFEAFIAAWLLRALENIDSDNEVRDFIVYAFAPKHNEVPDTTEFILNRLRILNLQQRNVLHSLLTEFAEYESSAFQRKLALDAVAQIESLR